MTAPWPAGMSLRDVLVQRNETTRLTPTQEAAFQRWVARLGIADVDSPESRYDYRGAFLDQLRPSINPTDGLPHWPDTYKQHGHPTFSRESKYSAGEDDGGSWGGMLGETFTPPRGLLDFISRLPRSPR